MGPIDIDNQSNRNFPKKYNCNMNQDAIKFLRIIRMGKQLVEKSKPGRKRRNLGNGYERDENESLHHKIENENNENTGQNQNQNNLENHHQRPIQNDRESVMKILTSSSSLEKHTPSNGDYSVNNDQTSNNNRNNNTNKTSDWCSSHLPFPISIYDYIINREIRVYFEYRLLP